MTAGVCDPTSTVDARVIQTPAPIPEAPLHGGQVLVYQVPIPEPCVSLNARDEKRRMHALWRYGLMHVKSMKTRSFGHHCHVTMHPRDR